MQGGVEITGLVFGERLFEGVRESRSRNATILVLFVIENGHDTDSKVNRSDRTPPAVRGL